MDARATITAPTAERRFTYRDLLTLPDDRNTYEIIDGALSVNASPSLRHQRISGRIYRILSQALEDTGKGHVFFAPMDVLLDRENVVQPDLVYIAGDRAILLEESHINGPPDLIIEVVSPSTRQRDLSMKRGLYARFGVPHYWVFDPEENSVLVYRREGETYREKDKLGAGDLFQPEDFQGLSFDLSMIFSR